MADQPPANTSTDVPVEGIIQPGQSLIEGRNTIDPYQPSDVFFEQKVRNFRSTDFALDSKTPIALRYKDCILMLFYNDMNREDRDTAAIWQEAARLSSVAIFAAVNLRTETAVGDAINQVKMDPNNPVYDFAPQGIPAIVVYRNQFPQAFYNGPREVQSIVDYALSLACDANYRERDQRRFGADTNSLQIPGGQLVRQPRISTDLILGQGLRQYGRDYGRTTIEQLERNAVPIPGTVATSPNAPAPPAPPQGTSPAAPPVPVAAKGAAAAAAPPPPPPPPPATAGTEEEEGAPGAATSETEETA